MAVYDEQFSVSNDQSRIGGVAYYVGGLVSLACLVSLVIWGYQLVVRDVSGIPVLRAKGGTMRISPEDPGGQISEHQGLSVNRIAAVGEVALPEDRLALAPMETPVAAEDLSVQPQVTSLAGNETRSGTQLEQVQVLSALSAPKETVNDALPRPVIAPRFKSDPVVSETQDQSAQGQGPDTQPSEQSQASGTFVAQSKRPQFRVNTATSALAVTSVSTSAIDAAVLTAAQAVTPVSAVSSAQKEALSTSVPAGTIMVQLGAFPSADQAAAHWTDLTAKFAPYMQDQTRVIQEASRAGSTFYRLRASGFGALSDARRFCTTFVSNGVECIPAVAR